MPPPDDDESEGATSGVRQELQAVAREHPRVSWASAILILLLLVAAVAGTGLAIWAFRKEGEARKAEQKAEAESQEGQAGRREICEQVPREGSGVEDRAEGARTKSGRRRRRRGVRSSKPRRSWIS